MKPLKLVMKAFGPYGKREEIDFRKLDDKGIFLITGRTGSGKTTIFDGISYALYGETSFNERNAESLRSQFADIDVLTEVELEFELKGKKYNVKRSPRQMGKRKRGEGLVERKPEATLDVEDENAKVITGVVEVNKKIESLMGISGDQFRQIMMIPQGEFRKLLVSDSQDREKVLRKIFDTTIYNSIQRKLGERASEIHRKIKDQQLTRDNAIRRFELHDSPDYNQLKASISAEDWDVETIIEQMKNVREFENSQLESLEKEAIDIANKTKEAITKKNVAEEHNRNIESIDELKQEREALNSQEEEHKNQEKMLKMAVDAQGIKPYEKHYNERKEEKEKNIKALENVEKAIIELQSREKGLRDTFDRLNREEVLKDIGEKRKEHTILSNNLEKVKERQKKIEELSRIKTALKNMELEMNDNKGKVEILDKKIEENDNKRTVLEEEFKTLSDVKGEFINIENRRKSLNRDKEYFTELYENLKTVFKERKRFIAEIEDVKVNIKESEEKKRNLIERLLNSQASVIATKLVEGEACPVCGSKDHPHINITGEDTISMEDIDMNDKWLNQFKDALGKLESDRAVLQDRYDNGKKNFDKIKQNISSEYGIEIAEEQKYPEIILLIQNKMEIYNKSISDIEKKVQRREWIELETKKIGNALKEDREKLLAIKNITENMEKELKASREYEIKLESSLKEIEKSIPAEYLELQNLKNRIDEINRVIQKWERDNKEAQDALQTLEKEISSNAGIKKNIIASQENIDTALKESRDKLENMIKKDFKDFEAYQMAKRDRAEIEGIQNRLDLYKKKRSENEVKLKEITSRVKSMEKINIEELIQAIAIIEEKSSEIDSRKGAINSRCNNNQNVVDEIEAITKAMGVHEKEYRVVGHMAKVAKGDNSYRMTFERYVLAAFLEDILNAANVRFKKMTGNRYLLSRTDELERKNKQSGLELQVYDNYTGCNRHVKTLSGGESFKASLSMALGLSDVVQSYAGGVRMDTMFIDEGFGTLDPESLDSAIECLIDLQKVGRLVGIISHVPELKERMEAQLVVHASNGGSRTEILLR